MKRLIALMLLIGFVMPLHAQDMTGSDVAGWVVADIRDIAAELDDHLLRQQSISPDGSIFAWTEADVLCLYVLESTTLKCFPFPDDSALQAGGSQYDRLAWSPDGRYIAMTPNFYIRYYEPDLWLFDVAASSFTNITEDRIYDVLDEPSALLDVFPFWDPANNLYFVRFVRDQQSTLQQVDLASGTLTTHYEFPLAFNDIPSVMPFPTFNPAGDSIAIGIYEFDRESPRNGIHILNADGELTQVAATADLIAMLPDWLEVRDLLPNGIIWTDAGLFVQTSSSTTSSVSYLSAVFFIDIETGEVRLLNEWSKFASADVYFRATDETAFPPNAYHAAVPPDGSALFYLAQFPEQNAQMIGQPAPEGDPTPLIRFDEPLFAARYAVSQSAHQGLQMLNDANQVLIGGYLYTFERE